MIADRSRAAATSTYRGELRVRSASRASERFARKFYEARAQLSEGSGRERQIAFANRITTAIAQVSETGHCRFVSVSLSILLALWNEEANGALCGDAPPRYDVYNPTREIMPCRSEPSSSSFWSSLCLAVLAGLEAARSTGPAT